jgi:hypothetical protein
VSPGQRAALLACALLAPAAVPACTLVLAEHRSGLELARLPLDPAAPALHITFTHSVLGTAVEDRYRFRRDATGWRAYLVQERGAGEGYGLPHTAGPGETLVRDSEGWRLTLNRPVHPLVVRPLPALRMRVQVHGQAPLLLGSLSRDSIELIAQGCPAPQGPPA